MNKNPAIDAYLKKAKNWKPEIEEMRSILQELNLTEELKWRLPCYTNEDANIAIIQVFKEYCALMFFKGALLKDSKKILKAPGQSQAARQIRFTSVQEVTKLKATIKSYIKEAIKIEAQGLKVEMKETKDYKVPEEFQKELDKNLKLKKAFEALTPGRQRGYLFYFSSAKQSKTREERVEKCKKLILSGKGLKEI